MHAESACTVLVEPSDYNLRNLGDAAMLEVALRRLAALLPHADIHVLTDDVNAFPAPAPHVRPIDARGRRLWFGDVSWDEASRVRAPWRVRQSVSRIENRVRDRAPALLSNVLRVRLRGDGARKAAQYFALAKNADLLVVTGMGGITDAFPEYSTRLLEAIGLSLRYDVPVAMLGQGIGPLQDPRLVRLAMNVLPRVHLIALRERAGSEPLLRSLGVTPDRICTTGDDAIDLAYSRRSDALGECVGVNVRIADYSAVQRAHLTKVGEVLRSCARRLGAPLLPVPISRLPAENDEAAIHEILAGEAPAQLTAVRSAAELVDRIQQCRIVVTGSYHAGVFALATGRPVVGLSNSAYYEQKFKGLADQFGGGCETVAVEGGDLQTRLLAAVERAWHGAPQLRRDLLAAAERQIAASRAAYARARSLIRDPVCA